MDFSALLGLLPYLLQAVSVAQNINSDIKSGATSSTAGVIATIQKEAPSVLTLFQNIGATLFPNVAAASQPAAAAIVLDVATVEKIQTAINTKLPAGDVPLDVDGQYGPKTKAAVAAFQTATGGLAADGWAGPLTQKALGIA